MPISFGRTAVKIGQGCLKTKEGDVSHTVSLCFRAGYVE